MQFTVDEAAGDLASALERRQFGFGLLDEALVVARRRCGRQRRTRRA